MIHRLSVLVVLVLAAGGCAGDADGSDPVPTLFGDDAESTSSTLDADDATSTTVTTTTLPIRDRLPELPSDIPGAVRADDGTIRAIVGTDGEVWDVRGACRAEAVEPAASAVLVGPQHVVLDPDGGGDGSAGAGLVLSLTDVVAAELVAVGIAVAATRESDVALSAPTRGAAGPAVGAAAFVTLALGEAGDATSDVVRPAVFHQIDDPESRRLGGLVHEALVAAWLDEDGPWAVGEEPGVRPLLNQRGEDYFVVLQASAGVPAVRVEVLADGERETALLENEEGRLQIGTAIADAIARFLVTDETGSGYVDPVETVRQAPTSNTPGACG
ncbi:MAG: N-acetylmuramoyl-L-alanine amidase [Acidimicrobiales bacterium]|nr:N-acetylmuramoyl-L-alanine amidase [Acidimicrobiales bacterium]